MSLMGYLHESRHLSTLWSARECKGQFLNAEDKKGQHMSYLISKHILKLWKIVVVVLFMMEKILITLVDNARVHRLVLLYSRSWSAQIAAFILQKWGSWRLTLIQMLLYYWRFAWVGSYLYFPSSLFIPVAFYISGFYRLIMSK